MSIPSEIQEAIKKNRLVVFVGSGLSRKFDLPSWSKLAEDIINDINDVNYNDLLPVLRKGMFTPIEVLDKLKNESTRIRLYVRDNFKVGKNHDLSLHKKILQLTNSIITTNYDNAFEEACSYGITPTKYTSNLNISEINKSGNPYIFKLHGCYTESDSCVIFSEDYSKLYAEETATKIKLKSIFIDKTILFLGFSFNDPDINMIFSKLDSLFDHHNHHYILAKDDKNFEKYQFLRSISIQDYDTEIDTFIDNCIKYKNTVNTSSCENTMVVKKDLSNIPRIAFLKPNPLDLKIDSELSNIEECFHSLNINLFSGYLNKRTLESIDDFDILIIATQVFKTKLYIEDDNLKSDLITAEEICNQIINDQIPIIFITNEKIDLVQNFNTINISTFKRATINKFIFKAFRNNELNFNANEEISIGLSKNLSNFEITKGTFKKSTIYLNDKTLDIGEKSLKNIIGRIEEQSIIASKLQSILRSNKVLNIKASGGTGKTTLIKKVSYELFNRGYFREGISFKSCENVKSFSDFEDLIHDAFKLRNILNFKEYLVEIYSYQKLDILIILDNFETIANSLENNEFKQVIGLIKFITDFANIALTSREKVSDLDDFEDLFSLAPLTTDDALALFQADYGNVKNESEIKILRHDILEELLNNNPLAIKLVTKSRTRFKHIEELRDQIKEQFFESLNEDFSSVFKSNADLNIERTKSIYQSINYSYTTLNSREKIAFELLSLFPDGISLTNFKKCFEKSTSTNNISDKELRILRDKSLVEDYNGTLQLQPIIRRFAEYQFLKRHIEVKQKYSLDAYIFNCHVLKIIDFVERKKSTSEALKIYNNFKNNLLNVFSYIPDIQITEKSAVSEKKYFLNYIYDLEKFIVNEKQIKDFYHKLNTIKAYFSDLPNAEIFINVLNLKKRYFHEEFEYSYSQLSNLMSPDDMGKRTFANEDYIECRYKDIISNIHNMEGYTINLIQTLIDNEDFSFSLDASFFYLGIPSNISREKNRFIYFEYELMFNRLNINQLESYINSLYSEEHLEIMQSTYTLSKKQKLDIQTIKKLVVTNPYTKGLKELMFAFNSDNNEEKDKYFINALQNLSHIKYYYLEALYFYSIFLKETGKNEYEALVEEGLKLSIKYYYQYIYQLFKNFKDNKSDSYDFKYSFYPVNGLEEYVSKHNNEWEKAFRDRNIEY